MVVGVAITEVPVVEDKPVAGDHIYVLAPVAVSVVDEPAQILTFEPALTTGKAFTVVLLVVGANAVQPAEVV